MFTKLLTEGISLCYSQAVTMGGRLQLFQCLLVLQLLMLLQCELVHLVDPMEEWA